MNYLEFIAWEAEANRRRAEIRDVLAHGSLWARLKLWWRLRQELRATRRLIADCERKRQPIDRR